MKPITKAIITAAGFGTRFLPATKNIPKELLPIINKPTIHYVVEDFIKNGIKDIIIVTRYGNDAIEDYFDSAPILEKYLEDKSKLKELEEIRAIYSNANFIFIRQNLSLPYGNASPLYSARNLINKGESFFYAWGDDIILGDGISVKEMLEIYNNQNADIILNCTKVDDNEISKLGIVKFKNNTQRIERIVEKPRLEDAFSNIASIAPYIFNSKIFDYLNPNDILPGREFMIQDTIDKICKDGIVLGNITKGKWLKTGDPLSYLKTTVEIALNSADLKDDFLKYLKSRLNQLSSD